MSSIAGARALVTGGAGFIGSELVRQLSHTSYVTAVDNLTNGDRENLADLDADRVRLIEADIRDERTMRSALDGVDVVFHLACLGVRHSLHSPRENHAVNADGTLGMLMLAREARIRRFVYVSSSEVYGTAKWAPMSEDHPTFPMTVYGASKLAGECYARAFHRSYGFPTVVVRPFNTYGPRSHHEGDCGEVIPKFLLRCLADEPMVIFGDGTQTRDFTYVSDTARAIARAAQVDRAVGETINVGSGTEVTVAALAREVARVAGRAVRVVHEIPRPGDVLRLFADATKARELLDFAPSVSLPDGLVMLRRWYEESGHSPAELLTEEVVRNWEPIRGTA